MERKGLELGVGLFLLLGLLCMAYLTVSLGKVRFLPSSDYKVFATFTNVGGLKPNADVTMAGVKIGQVESIQLKKGRAQVALGIRQDIQLEEDVIASIKTMGIVGDRYISISPGASDTYLGPGGTIHETQPPLDIEQLVGKFVFGSMEKEKGDGNKKDKTDLGDSTDTPDKLDK